jgi:Skp family chaperone for outer membrane proteins
MENSVKLAVVDLQRIINSDSQFAASRKKIESTTQELRTTLDKEQRNLHMKEIELQKKQKILDQKSLEREIQKIQNAKQQIMYDYRQAVQKLEIDTHQAQEVANKRVQETLAAVAKEKNYKGLFDRSTLLFTKTSKKLLQIKPHSG